jgi:hypothetical protein
MGEVKYTTDTDLLDRFSKKYSNTKFNEYPSRRSRDVNAEGETVERTDRTT